LPGAQQAEDTPADLTEHRDLFGGERVEHQLADHGDVARGGSGNGGAAGLGEDDERAAAVGRAPLPLDEPPPLHSGQVMGQATLLPGEGVADLEHAQPPVRGLAERDQHVIVGQRQPVRVLELPVQPGVQARGQLQQPTPGRLLVVAEPVGHPVILRRNE